MRFEHGLLVYKKTQVRQEEIINSLYKNDASWHFSDSGAFDETHL